MRQPFSVIAVAAALFTGCSHHGKETLYDDVPEGHAV